VSADKEAQRSHGSSKAQSRPRERLAAFALPLTVVSVVVVLIGGLLLSYEGQQPRPGAGPGEGTVATARPLPTRPLPYPDAPRITLQETQDKLAQGQAVLIDVRSRTSYDKAHAAAALSFPEDEIQDRLGELPAGLQWILYCT